MKKILLGLILGLIIVPLGAWAYLEFGSPPVAVADHPFPYEKQIVHIPLNKRIHEQAPKTVPISATPANVLAGASIYHDQCEICHGAPGHGSELGRHMYPPVPQLWYEHRPGVVGVSDDPPGVTYWKVANGIRLTGMPSFDKILSTTQMWQVSLLLKHANEPQSAAVEQILEEPLLYEPPTGGNGQAAPGTKKK